MGRNAQREGDVGVVECQVQPRAYAQMRVHRAQETRSGASSGAGRRPGEPISLILRGQLGAVGPAVLHLDARSAAWANVAAMASMVANLLGAQVDLRGAPWPESELTLMPLPAVPKLKDARGAPASGRRHVACSVEPGDGLAQRVAGLGCRNRSNCGPPGPVKTSSKRRLPGPAR